MADDALAECFECGQRGHFSYHCKNKPVRAPTPTPSRAATPSSTAESSDGGSESASEVSDGQPLAINVWLCARATICVCVGTIPADLRIVAPLPALLAHEINAVQTRVDAIRAAWREYLAQMATHGLDRVCVRGDLDGLAGMAGSAGKRWRRRMLCEMAREWQLCRRCGSRVHRLCDVQQQTVLRELAICRAVVVQIIACRAT